MDQNSIGLYNIQPVELQISAKMLPGCPSRLWMGTRVPSRN